MTSALATILICIAAIAGVLARPLRWPEAVWAIAGAGCLVAFGLLPWREALAAIARGGDVYLFLGGMMLLSEIARREGVFDWLAAHAVGWARGSSARLFALVYAVGIGVTALLSNDATAVVMTPAVYAAARQAEVDPLPSLFACAFVANAASFVLPISNPANLVLYGGQMPPLGAWLAAFGLPSIMAIGATFVMLRLVERDRLRAPCRVEIAAPVLGGGGRLALAAIGATALLLLGMSLADRALGVPTFVAGAVTAGLVFLKRPQDMAPVLRQVSWSVLLLVAGLFVLVAGLERIGLVDLLAAWLGGGGDPRATAAIAGGGIAIAANLVNNLPAGLVASATVAAANPPQMVTDALLIGVDLGPNLSITGSLATILWLAAIRREGEHVTFWRFLKVGVAVMPPALVLAIGARLALG
ncbi:arsenic transporter [Hephaestia sp. GCM10023244]|uniref:arsenic transporter n=1 Tax=unclassified Hephaestia TaxID=2631281 RepID=UPI0020778552|nr:arsenic transporter [Hephaestia sp. MAHUQ-44]MCM8729379.1 arsenic transporter [Hephaestia sp. MAHUQ-44]